MKATIVITETEGKLNVTVDFDPPAEREARSSVVGAVSIMMGALANRMKAEPVEEKDEVAA